MRRCVFEFKSVFSITGFLNFLHYLIILKKKKMFMYIAYSTAQP
jgi:hypothetical protein